MVCPDSVTTSRIISGLLLILPDGHYLNLPVIEENTVIGMVDVLKLTYATLEQIHSIQGGDGEGTYKPP